MAVLNLDITVVVGLLLQLCEGREEAHGIHRQCKGIGLVVIIGFQPLLCGLAVGGQIRGPITTAAISECDRSAPISSRWPTIAEAISRWPLWRITYATVGVNFQNSAKS